MVFFRKAGLVGDSDECPHAAPSFRLELGLKDLGRLMFSVIYLYSVKRKVTVFEVISKELDFSLLT